LLHEVVGRREIQRLNSVADVVSPPLSITTGTVTPLERSRRQIRHHGEIGQGPIECTRIEGVGVVA